MKTSALAVFLLFASLRGSQAATITAETIAAWNGAMEQSRAAVVANPSSTSFRPVSSEGRRAKGRPTIAVFSPDGSSRPVPSGYLHTWVGKLFIPEAHSADVLAALQDYSAYPEVYGPAVATAELLEHRGDAFRYRLRFVQKGFGVRAALKATFESKYHQINGREGYSMTEATELVELRSAESGCDDAVPQEKARGFVERSFTIVRYREAAGGTEIQVETLTLSREIPGSIRWIAMPLVRKFAAQTMTATLTRLSDRVQVVSAHRVSASLTPQDRLAQRP